MAEPSKIRTKSPKDLTNQLIRLADSLKSNGTDARRLAVSKAYNEYMESIFNTPAMQRAMAKAGADTDVKKMIFLSSFGGSSDVQVPVRQYRKNNRILFMK